MQTNVNGQGWEWLSVIPTLKLFGNKCYFRFLNNILNTSLPSASQENLRFTWRPCPLRGCQRGHILVKRPKDKGATHIQAGATWERRWRPRRTCCVWGSASMLLLFGHNQGRMSRSRDRKTSRRSEHKAGQRNLVFVIRQWSRQCHSGLLQEEWRNQIPALESSLHQQ